MTKEATKQWWQDESDISPYLPKRLKNPNAVKLNRRVLETFLKKLKRTLDVEKATDATADELDAYGVSRGVVVSATAVWRKKWAPATPPSLRRQGMLSKTLQTAMLERIGRLEIAVKQLEARLGIQHELDLQTEDLTPPVRLTRKQASKKVAAKRKAS